MKNYKSLLRSIAKGLSSNTKDEFNRTLTHHSSQRVYRASELIDSHNLSKRKGTPELDIAGVQVMNLRLFGDKGHINTRHQ
jgi:hypothetical protein